MMSAHAPERPRSGFTLLEVSIVMVVLGIVLSIGLPLGRVYLEQLKLTEDRRIMTDLKNALIGDALVRGGVRDDTGNVIPVNNVGLRGVNAYNNDIQYYANALLTETATGGNPTTLCDTARDILDGTTASTTPAICNDVSEAFVDCADSTVQLFVIVSPGTNRAAEHENDDGDTVFENPSKKPNALNDYDDIVESFSLTQLVHECQAS